VRIGLVDEVVAPDRVQARALELARELARGAVAAHGLAKRAIDEGLSGTLAEGLELEQELFAASFATEDSRIGVESFLQHGPGKAAFTGH
jgi:enoyl-CoA hydratase